MKAVRLFKQKLAGGQSGQKHPPAARAEINRDVESVVHLKNQLMVARHWPRSGKLNLARSFKAGKDRNQKSYWSRQRRLNLSIVADATKTFVRAALSVP